MLVATSAPENARADPEAENLVSGHARSPFRWSTTRLRLKSAPQSRRGRPLFSPLLYVLGASAVRSMVFETLSCQVCRERKDTDGSERCHRAGDRAAVLPVLSTGTALPR